MTKFFVESFTDLTDKAYAVVERERGVAWATFYDFDGEPSAQVRAKQYAAFLETLIEVQDALTECGCGHTADMHYGEADFPGQPPCNEWGCGCMRFHTEETL